MRRMLPLALLIASTSLSMGCAMCCSPYDYAFGYYGGAWQRDDLCNGRVGSIYAPAGSQVYVPKKKAAPDKPADGMTPSPGTYHEDKVKPDLDANYAPEQLRSVKRTRPATPAKTYLPEND